MQLSQNNLSLQAIWLEVMFLRQNRENLATRKYPIIRYVLSTIIHYVQSSL